MMQSRKLLYTRLFNSEEKCPLDLREIADQILQKCDGLPLAVIAISGVLAGKRSKDQWERVKDSIGRGLRNSSIDTILSLSYLDLPPNLRTCLLYLSIFPEDHIIEKENLIRRWIGEGFIHQQESGELCFNELINRSLIQPAEIDDEFGCHAVKSCRVHDTLLDFIVSKAVEENFVTIIGVPGVNYDTRMKVRRLSLQNNGEIPADLVFSSARSLHVFGPKVKIPSVSQFWLLRVMDFDNCSQLKDDDVAGIGNLLHLKYLRLHARTLKALPEELARLPELQIDIHGCHEKLEIPETFQRLASNVALYAGRYDTVPDEMAAVQGLRVLEGLSIRLQSIEFLKGLGQLKNLRRLSYYHDGWWERLEQAASSACELGKAGLESLQLYIDFSRMVEFFEMDIWFRVPPYSLRELVVEGNYTTVVPSKKWMASLVNLEKLHLRICKMDEEDVKILAGLPCLRHLCIECVCPFEREDLYGEAASAAVKKAMEDRPTDLSEEEAEAAVKKAMEDHPNRPSFVWTYDR